jgi:hypothetical protein
MMSGEQMSSTKSWDVISGPGSDLVILGVDFPAAGRDEAGFAELATLIGPGYKFMQTIPPTVSLDERTAGGVYVQRWIQEARRSQWPVKAVLGFCVGSVYAAPITEAIAEWQQPAPKLILLDPMPSDTGVLGLEMYKIIRRLAPLMPSDEVEHAEKKTAELIAEKSEDVEGAAIDLLGIYREFSSPVFARLGLDAVRINEMIRLFASYMSWVSCAAQVDQSRAWKSSTAIMSAEYVRLMSGAEPDGDWMDVIGNKIVFEVTHGNLLRSDDTVQAILEHMETP